MCQFSFTGLKLSLSSPPTAPQPTSAIFLQPSLRGGRDQRSGISGGYRVQFHCYSPLPEGMRSQSMGLCPLDYIQSSLPANEVFWPPQLPDGADGAGRQALPSHIKGEKTRPEVPLNLLWVEGVRAGSDLRAQSLTVAFYFCSSVPFSINTSGMCLHGETEHCLPGC